MDIKKPDTDGILYHLLVSHEKVENFRNHLYVAVQCPELYHPALVSIGRRLHVDRAPLSQKQVLYALDLINKTSRS